MKLSKEAVETSRRFEIKKCNRKILITLFATVNGIEEDVLIYDLSSKDQRLAARLGAAWVGKAFFKELVIKPYNERAKSSGEGYLWHKKCGDVFPLGRTLNADLDRLGF
ncbi:MAG: hypothetical protein KGI50_07130 [Patescibacteria group bacterium]|nr:hypothetical protein [Patescibacteria group bacterium]MDE2439147.1 hypothetical protein [Patescibacteria group bacterium]